MLGRGMDWLSIFFFSFDQEIFTEQLLCARYNKNFGYFGKQKNQPPTPPKEGKNNNYKKKRKRKDQFLLLGIPFSIFSFWAGWTLYIHMPWISFEKVKDSKIFKVCEVITKLKTKIRTRESLKDVLFWNIFWFLVPWFIFPRRYLNLHFFNRKTTTELST